VKEVQHDGRRIRAQRLLHQITQRHAEQLLRQVRSVNVGHIAAQHQRRLALTGHSRQPSRLSHAQLNGIRPRLHRSRDSGRQVLDSRQKLRIVEDPMIDR
jgi:hypothetical protein